MTLFYHSTEKTRDFSREMNQLQLLPNFINVGMSTVFNIILFGVFNIVTSYSMGKL